MSLLEGTFLGRYEVVAKLGAGGMGEVYRARDGRLDRDVAIKVLPEKYSADANALARFLREGKAVAALSHPNIVAVFDIGTEGGRPFTVMELLEGETLAGLIRSGPLETIRVLQIAAQVAEGLAAAHVKGIIHRDIKPENIFLVRAGLVKILDFGLARLDQRGQLAVTQQTASYMLDTQPGLVMGTVSYMSPEQLRGQPADARTDVFSFGCMLYEMLSGKKPFQRSSGADTMSAILNESPERLRLADNPALERLVLRCLEKEATRRYGVGVELAAALKQVPGSGPPAETEAIALTPRSGTHAIAQGPSVAVLPFVNMSSDVENEYFSDGLAEELLNVLAKVPGLHVAARTSAFAFKGKNEDVRKIAEQLSVRAVLEGSVRKSGNRLRITAKLVNAADGFQLWSETYNRTMEDVFAIQDEIAQHIATALRGVLTEKDKRALDRPQTSDVRAYDFYLRGRQYFHQFRRKGYLYALEMFLRAAVSDPHYALAHAGMADCHSLLYTYWEHKEEHRMAADADSRKAIEEGPELAEAHVARGLALSLFKKFDEAAQEYTTAIRLNPKLYEAHYFFARACNARGLKEEAINLFEKALTLRPDDYQSCTHLATLYEAVGRGADAQASAKRAIEVAEARLALNPDEARALYLGAIMHTRLGDVKRADEWAARALAVDPEEPVTLYNVACLYALQKKIEAALICLEKAVGNGFTHKQWIEHDSDLDSLRGEPRFQAILDKL